MDALHVVSLVPACKGSAVASEPARHAIAASAGLSILQRLPVRPWEPWEPGLPPAVASRCQPSWLGSTGQTRTILAAAAMGFILILLVILMLLMLYSVIREAGLARPSSQNDARAKRPPIATAEAYSRRQDLPSDGQDECLPPQQPARPPRAPALRPPPPPPPVPHRLFDRPIHGRRDGYRDGYRDGQETAELDSVLPDYLIEYTDAHGISTERRLTIQHVDREMITAYCHLRRAVRRFYSPRISRCVNCCTGEIIADIHADIAIERQRHLDAHRREGQARFQRHGQPPAQALNRPEAVEVSPLRHPSAGS